MKENLKEKENKMSMNVLILESVGSCITCDGTTYPLNVDGTPDMSSGVHYKDTSEEFLNNLSFDDAAEAITLMLKSSKFMPQRKK